MNGRSEVGGGGRTAAADELAIRNLVGRLAHLVDDGELDEYIQLVAEDAIIEVGNSLRRGRTEILEAARGRRESGLSGRGTSRHVVTNTTVRIVEDDTTATADSYFLFVRDTTTSPAVQHVGRYHDEFRYSDGTWRLARRQIQVG